MANSVATLFNGHRTGHRMAIVVAMASGHIVEWPLELGKRVGRLAR